MKRVIYIMSIVLSTVFGGCTDWLTITPDTTVVAENLFTTDDGVQEALHGSYILLRNVYGPTSIIGGASFSEGLAGTWPASSGSVEFALVNHDYNLDNLLLGEHFNSAFSGFYTIVANINPLIEGLDENRANLDSATYNIVKGEALAIRACIHLDLIRLWGPMPSKIDASKAYLPYVTHNSTKKYTYYTYDEYMKMLFADLNEAERLLKKSDPILELPAGNTVEYYSKWTKRQCHFNYYGVLGLKARALLWNNETEEALRYARLIKDATNTDGSLKFKLANNEYFTAMGEGMYDATFYCEHLCGISSENYDIKNGAFSATNGTAKIYVFNFQMQFVASLFDGNSADLRCAKQWTYRGFAPNVEVRCRKYEGFYAESKSGAQNMPVVRLAEMYLMLMECAPLEEANRVYQEFCTARNLTYKELTAENRKERVTKEYIREFIAEGQTFFAYKRMAVEEMYLLWTPTEPLDPCGEDQYVLPLPPKEY